MTIGQLIGELQRHDENAEITIKNARQVGGKRVFLVCIDSDKPSVASIMGIRGFSPVYEVVATILSN